VVDGVDRIRVAVSPEGGGFGSFAAEMIGQAVRRAVEVRGSCSLMLTGGRTARSVYQEWARAGIWWGPMVTAYHGDERCVPSGHEESNHGGIDELLGGVLRIEPIDAMAPNRESAASDYARRLPDRLDVLMLSMGDDGHIASLFPGSMVLDEHRRRVVATTGPKAPVDRFTITAPVISEAREVFVMVVGGAKGRVLAEAATTGSPTSHPVLIASSATHLLDQDACEAFLRAGGRLAGAK